MPLTYFNRDYKSSGRQYSANCEVRFLTEKEPDAGDRVEIKVESEEAVQILSIRLNGKECSWHWEGDILAVEADRRAEGNRLELLAVTEDGSLVSFAK